MPTPKAWKTRANTQSSTARNPPVSFSNRPPRYISFQRRPTIPVARASDHVTHALPVTTNRSHSNPYPGPQQSPGPSSVPPPAQLRAPVQIPPPPPPLPQNKKIKPTSSPPQAPAYHAPTHPSASPLLLGLRRGFIHIRGLPAFLLLRHAR